MTTTEVNRVGGGDVDIMLADGQKITLKPTWGAAVAISRTYGGMVAAMERVGRLDLEASMNIMMIGMGYTGNRHAPKGLEEKIWQTGFTDATGSLAERVIYYLRVLAGGGKVPDDKKGNDGDENPSPMTTTG